MIKNFEDLQAGDKVYLVKPYTREIHETTVKASALHPKSRNKMVWVLDIYTILDFAQFSVERLDRASEGLGTKVTLQIFVQKNTFQSIILVNPAPTVICTDKIELEKWLNQMNPSDFELVMQVANLRNQKQLGLI